MREGDERVAHGKLGLQRNLLASGLQANANRLYPCNGSHKGQRLANDTAIGMMVWCLIGRFLARLFGSSRRRGIVVAAMVSPTGRIMVRVGVSVRTTIMMMCLARIATRSQVKPGRRVSSGEHAA